MPGNNHVALFSRTSLSLLFIVAGTLHFVFTELFVQIVPPLIPYKEAIIYLSGCIEIVLGILINVKPFRVRAAWAMIVFLIAVFPANVYMLMIHHEFRSIPLWLLYLRLSLQGLFIYWAYKLARNN